MRRIKYESEDGKVNIDLTLTQFADVMEELVNQGKDGEAYALFKSSFYTCIYALRYLALEEDEKESKAP